MTSIFSNALEKWNETAFKRKATIRMKYLLQNKKLQNELSRLKSKHSTPLAIYDVNISNALETFTFKAIFSNALETFTQTFQCVQAAQPSPHKAALASPKQLHTTSNTRHQYFLTRWKNGIQEQEL
jgi:hypothetical protein